MELPQSFQELLSQRLQRFVNVQMTSSTRNHVVATVKQAVAEWSGTASDPVALPRVLFFERNGTVLIGDLDASMYRAHFGVPPERDDLERANCTCSGVLGHSQCGVCEEHELPRFMCGCLVTWPEPSVAR